jgi:hypothetical protein
MSRGIQKFHVDEAIRSFRVGSGTSALTASQKGQCAQAATVQSHDNSTLQWITTAHA